MGNNLSGPKHVKLGSHTTVDVTREKPKREDGGGYSQGWTASYTTYDQSSCTLYLEKTVDKRDRVSEVFLQLEDDMCSGGGIRVWIRAQSNALDVEYKYDKSFRDTMLSKSKDTSITTTKVFNYGRGSKRGHVVVETKKKSKYEGYPCTATVSHCYVVSAAPANSSRIDIGLSTVVSIRVSNNNLDFKVGGPTRHPPSAMSAAFEQLSLRGTWNSETQRQCSGFSEQSETESEDDSEGSETESDGSETESDGTEIESEDRYRRGNVHNNNKNITGDGNGNRINGNQKFENSLNFIYHCHKLA